MLQVWVYRFVKGCFLLLVHQVLRVDVALVAALWLHDGCVLVFIGGLESYAGYPPSGLAPPQALARGLWLLHQHGSSVLNHWPLVHSVIRLPLSP